MGMFDDIIVPKSYLKGLLTKEQEKLVKDNNYQTKSLENFLGQYKVYKQKLFVKENKEWVRDTRSGKLISTHPLVTKMKIHGGENLNSLLLTGSLIKKN